MGVLPDFLYLMRFWGKRVEDTVGWGRFLLWGFRGFEVVRICLELQRGQVV